MAVAAGVAGPAISAAVGIAIAPDADIAATTLLLLSVVVSSIVSGRVGGLLAAVISVLALNFFWTEPKHTFRVSETADVVSLLVFVTIALVVGDLVARLGRERARVEEHDVARAELRSVAEQLEGERTRLDVEAREARERAEVERIRGALFSSVSHDLRTPLSTIKAGVTSLMDPTAHHDVDARGELLGSMLEETDRLNRLVGNILSLAKARAGGLALNLELVPFDDVVEGVLRRLGSRSGRVAIVPRLRDELPACWLDPIQVDQALTNVIENAVRFAPADTEVVVAAVPWHGGVQVRVSDRGQGIDPAERERVFEPFVRSGDRSPGGSGLGLAIAKAVVVAHGGRIWVEGTPGGGCTIVIELPAGRSKEER